MHSLTLSQKYIVLPGGFDSSAYLRTKLQSAFVSTEILTYRSLYTKSRERI